MASSSIPRASIDEAASRITYLYRWNKQFGPPMHQLDFSIPGLVFLPLDATTNAFKAILGSLRFRDECRGSTRGKVVVVAPAVMMFLWEAGEAAAQHGHTAWRDSHFPPTPAEAARASLQSVHTPAPAAFADSPALTQQQRERIAYNRERALERRRRTAEDAVAAAESPAPIVAPVAVVRASAAPTRRRSDTGRRQRSQQLPPRQEPGARVHAYMNFLAGVLAASGPDGGGGGRVSLSDKQRRAVAEQRRRGQVGARRLLAVFSAMIAVAGGESAPTLPPPLPATNLLLAPARTLPLRLAGGRRGARRGPPRAGPRPFGRGRLPGARARPGRRAIPGRRWRRRRREGELRGVPRRRSDPGLRPLWPRLPLRRVRRRHGRQRAREPLQLQVPRLSQPGPVHHARLPLSARGARSGAAVHGRRKLKEAVGLSFFFSRRRRTWILIRIQHGH